MPLGAPDERRECTRVRARTEVEVRSDAYGVFYGWTQDVSLKGFFLKSDRPMPVGTSCRMTVLLEGRGNDPRIAVQGQVMRVNDSGVGVHITEILDLQSYRNLRDFVLSHAPEPEIVTREIQGQKDLEKIS